MRPNMSDQYDGMYPEDVSPFLDYDDPDWDPIP